VINVSPTTADGQKPRAGRQGGIMNTTTIFNDNLDFEHAVCDSIENLKRRESTHGERNFPKIGGLYELLTLGRRGTDEQAAFIFANTARLIKFCERKERSRGGLLKHINKQLAK